METSKLIRVKLLIIVIWSILSISCGYSFVKNNSFLGMENPSFGILSHEYKSGNIWLLIAYIFTIIMICIISFFVINAIFINGKERSILLYSIPALLLFSLVLLREYTKASGQYNYYQGDEKNIWDAAMRLWPFGFVYSSELFLICFLLIPTVLAPSIIKVLFCSFVFGYIIYRCKECKSKWVYLLYFFLLLPPVFEMGIRVHRMHWYGWLYLFWTTKVYFDSKRIKNKFSFFEVLAMSFICALLTVWRREGIYLILLGCIVLIIAYGRGINGFVKERVVKITTFVVGLTLLLYYPPMHVNGANEAGTTYAAFVVHALGEEDLDRSKVSEELDIIDQYLDIEIIDKYNSEIGRDGFVDCYYLWPEWNNGDYYAVRNGASISDPKFSNAVLNLVKKQPIAFLKSRIKATNIAFCNGSITYNLYISSAFLIVIIFYAFKEKDTVLLVLLLGILMHSCITALTMPASYFKYFYEMYLFSYFFIGFVICETQEKIIKKKAV